MKQVPAELTSGQGIRGMAGKINELIRYLKGQRLSVDNRTLSLNEHANGITLSAKLRSAGRLPATTGGGYNEDFTVIIERRDPGEPENEETNPKMLKIVFGSNRDFIYDEQKVAGRTDVIAPGGGALHVPVGEFPLPTTGSMWYILLTIQRETEGDNAGYIRAEYKLHDLSSGGLPQAPIGYEILAGYYMQNPEKPFLLQLWTRGAIRFSEKYIISPYKVVAP